MIFEKIYNKLNSYLYENKELSSLSKELQDKLLKWDESKVDIKRLTWHAYFMSHAFISSLRSCDATSKHGCVLVNSSNEIISEGYNSFIRGIDDRILPNFGAEKYKFFCHSEESAIINCARRGVSTYNTIAYVTGKPCFFCVLKLWQSGISKIFYGSKYIKMVDNKEYEEDIELFNFITQKRMPLIHLDFDENKLKEIFN